MQKHQINLIRTYLLITLFLVGIGFFFPSNQNLWLYRYFVVLSLFIVSVFYQVKGKSHTHFPYALLFAAIGDAFLYLPIPLKFIKPNIPLGLLSFGIAYLIIASVYMRILIQRDKSAHRMLYLKQSALLIMMVSIIIYFLRKSPMDYLTFGAIFISALLLVFMSAINLYFSTFFTVRLRRLIMISSALMLICDVGVILGFTLQGLDPIIYRIGTSIVWSAYIPAWTILCMISMDAEFNKAT